MPRELLQNKDESSPRVRTAAAAASPAPARPPDPAKPETHPSDWRQPVPRPLPNQQGPKRLNLQSPGVIDIQTSLRTKPDIKPLCIIIFIIFFKPPSCHSIRKGASRCPFRGRWAGEGHCRSGCKSCLFAVVVPTHHPPPPPPGLVFFFPFLSA